jgi:RNA recognition motif-containing protein
MEGSKKKKAID